MYPIPCYQLQPFVFQIVKEGKFDQAHLLHSNEIGNTNKELYSSRPHKMHQILPPVWRKLLKWRYPVQYLSPLADNVHIIQRS